MYLPHDMLTTYHEGMGNIEADKSKYDVKRETGGTSSWGGAEDTTSLPSIRFT